MKNRKWLIVLLALLLPALLANPPYAAEDIVIGRVTDAQNIITGKGIVYEVALTDLGDELLIDHDGDLVEVLGTIESSDGFKIITVISYTVLEE